MNNNIGSVGEKKLAIRPEAKQPKLCNNNNKDEYISSNVSNELGFVI